MLRVKEGNPMIYKNILAYINGNFSKTLSQQALLITEFFEAQLRAVHVTGDPRESIPLLGEGMSVAMIEDIVDATKRESLKRKEKARADFDESLAGSALASADGVVEFIEEFGRDEAILCRLGRLADLILCPCASDVGDVSQLMALNSVIFDSGRPVLVMPDQCKPKFPYKNILISWNGSKESARAIGLAIPFLQMSERNIVFSLESPSNRKLDIDELTRYLSGHNIQVEVVKSRADISSVGKHLLNQAQVSNVDLIVMGAYTQTRMRRLVLGGVTRHVLENTKVQVLMAH